MAKYLKKFTTHAQYNDYITGNNVILPNVSLCDDRQEIHYNPEPFVNGYEYVDLGLPSGTLWAVHNIGSSGEIYPGTFFQWGDVEGTDVDAITYSEWGTYRFSDNGASGDPRLTKYCTDASYGANNFVDNKYVLDLTDDAAHAIMGGPWHMPTEAQWNELAAYQVVSETKTFHYENVVMNVEGYKVIGPNGNSVFFPKAPFIQAGGTQWVDESACLWSTVKDSSGYDDYATYYSIDDTDGIQKQENVAERAASMQIRGVIG